MVEGVGNLPEDYFRKTKKRINFKQGMFRVACNVGENSRMLGTEK